MNLHRPIRSVALSDDARDNVARIQAIWAECYQRYGKQGPFLFGAFGGADAMFAPVVHRFRTYAIPVEGDARHYVDAMMALPAFQNGPGDGLARDATDRPDGGAVKFRKSVTRIPTEDGNRAWNSGYADSLREPAGLALITLKTKRNSQVCHASILLAFWACGVLG